MRLSRHEMWMEIAAVAAKRSTCWRGNVGAIAVHRRQIVAFGYNGPPSGHPHCEGAACATNSIGGCARSVHAEENVLQRLPRDVIDQSRRLAAATSRMTFEPVTLYVTCSPCPVCALRIVAHPIITRLFYREQYRDQSGVDRLLEEGLSVYRLTPAGHVIDRRTNQLLESEGVPS